MRRRHLLTTAALAAPALALGTGSARAQAFPSRPIRIVVPFAPGGAVDITGRLLAEKLQPILNQQLLVENRGGAGGNLGADVVAKAEKDGHTILLGTATILAANKFLFRRGMPFDAARDFAPVTRVSTGTVLLVVNSQRPWQNFGELIEAARRAPGRLTMGSSGTGTASHLTISAVSRAAGVDITHVPYRGGGPAVLDVVGGHLDALLVTLPAAIEHIRGGRLKALAMTSLSRNPALPDVPTVAEQGLEGFEVVTWQGILAPAGTPPAVIERLNTLLLAALRTPEVAESLTRQGFELRGSTPAAFAQLIQTESARWPGIVRLAGATLD